MPSPLASRNTVSTPGATKAPVIPAPLRAAMEFIVANDSRSDSKTLHGKALEFLKLARDVIADPEAKFAQCMVAHYLAAIFPRNAGNLGATIVDFREKECLSPEIASGFKQQFSLRLATGAANKMGPVQFYESPFGVLPRDVKGVMAFQRDYLKHVGTLIDLLERTSEVPAPLAKVVDQLSGFVMGFCSEALNLNPDERKRSASELAQFLLHCGDIDPLSLKAAITILKARENGISSLEAAIKPLLDRARPLGVSISPEMEGEMREWTKLKAPLYLSRLSAEERAVLVRSLRVSATRFFRSEDGERFELEWMAKVQEPQRNREYLYDKADATPRDISEVPLYPAVNQRFSRMLRLTMRELNDLKRAADFLAEKGLVGHHIEMAQSPYLWPRLAESILLAKPTRVTLHSPTALEPFESPTSEGSPPFLCQREFHVIPVTMTTSPRQIIEQEFCLASKAVVAWESGTSGECVIDGQKVSVRIDADLSISELTSAALPHVNPFANCFLIRHRDASLSESPVAFGYFFPASVKDIPDHTSHPFGKTVQLYIAQERKPAPVEISQAQTMTPVESPRSVEQLLASPTVEVAIPSTENTTPPPTPKPEVIATKKVKREPPPPPPPREPRPKISEHQALSAKAAIASLPEIQGVARASTSLKPVVPFTQADVVTTLHILRNGEKPGNKALKALRAYVADDANFRDAIRSKTISVVRANIKGLVDELLT